MFLFSPATQRVDETKCTEASCAEPNVWRKSKEFDLAERQTVTFMELSLPPPGLRANRDMSKDVFERRRSTASEAFSLFMYLDANKFVLLSFFSLIKRIYRSVSIKPPPNDAKSPLLVDVRRSKTLLLKLPNM